MLEHVLEVPSKSERHRIAEILETEDGRLVLNQEDVDALLEADGDGNPVHGPRPSGYSGKVFSERVPAAEFDEFQADIYDAMPPFDDPDDGNRPLSPGMAVFEHIGYHEDRALDRIEIDWTGPAHHSDTQSGSDVQEIQRSSNESSAVYDVEKVTPEGERAETAEARVEYASGEPVQANYKKTALAGALVARTDRSGDFLAGLELDYNEDVDWEELDLETSEIVYTTILSEENGLFTSQGTVSTRDGKVLAEAAERFGHIDEYEEIRENYSRTPGTPAARMASAVGDLQKAQIKAGFEAAKLYNPLLWGSAD